MTLSGDFMFLARAALSKALKISHIQSYHINEEITCCYGANAYDERSHASASKS